MIFMIMSLQAEDLSEIFSATLHFRSPSVEQRTRFEVKRLIRNSP